ncbi:MAG: tRNA (adenosine(37)-N6)-threonylcarbamoyltransferase complex dimerization subunit type 1 TsaB [Flavipsychrobacter sp.]
MAYILHIDTSADSGLTAISKAGQLVAQKVNTDARNNASIINKDIESVLKTAGISLKDIASIAVCSGPGSYTGLRIGTSTAKGICYAIDKPLMMHSKLLLIAHEVWNDLNRSQHSNKYTQFYSIIPAREGEYFISGYDKDFIETIEPCHILEEEVMLLNLSPNTLVIGEMDEKIVAFIEQKKAGVHTSFKAKEANAESWALYAYEQHNSKSFVNLANSEPNYLKKVYTHKPKSSK